MIEFRKQEFTANFSDAAGKPLARTQQVRTDPVTMKQCRITPSRALENERGTENLYQPPEIDLKESKCSFCPENLESMAPCLNEQISKRKRFKNKKSILFPNLFPYTEWSAVSLFDTTHHVEIGTASPKSYHDSFINCSDYLTRVKRADPWAIFMSITQNHLPGAGGSLVHPHLQVHAAKQISTSHALLQKRAREHAAQYSKCILSDLLLAERGKH